MPWQYVLLTALLTAEPAPPPVEVDPGDKALTITGWVGEDATFVTNLRLTGHGKEPVKFTFLPSDLKGKEPGEVVGRQHVELVGDPTLAPEQPRNFQVKVTGVKLPGTYQGELRLLLPGTPPAEALSVALTVIGQVHPTLSPVLTDNKLQLQLVRGGWLGDRALARLLLPDSAFLDTCPLPLDNPLPAAVTIARAQLVASGKETRFPLTDAQVRPPGPTISCPAGQITNLELTLSRADMPPDLYVGDLYLTLQGGDKRVRVPFELSVRSGPFWPVVVLLFGIVVGRLFKYMQDRGGPQAAALVSINRAELRVGTAHPEDRRLLAPMLDEVRRAAYQDRLQEVPAALTAIDARLTILNELRAVEDTLTPRRGDRDVDTALGKIEEARRALANRQDTTAKALLEQVKTVLANLATRLQRTAGQPDPGTRGVELAADHVAAAQTAAARIVPEAGVPPESRWLSRLKRALVALTGLSDEIRAEATLWLVRPLLYFVLLLGLLAVGLDSLYVTKGATFGARPFSDYLGLVLWGLGADVASRNLSNLKG
jgi:hypothetical protein